MFIDFSGMIYPSFFFFFQAEDGIRDLTVTGVQTCALPIWSARRGVAKLAGGIGGSDHSSGAGARGGLCATRDRSLPGSPKLFPWRDRRLPQRARVRRVARPAATVVSERRRATSLGVSVIRGILRLFRSRRAQADAAVVRGGQRFGVHRAAAVAPPGSPPTTADLRRPRGTGAHRVAARGPRSVSPPGRNAGCTDRGPPCRRRRCERR